MASAEQTLQQISDYIDKYEHDLALRESIVNLGNATTRQQIAMQKAHLADLKAKYAYLQTYYAQHGELPATVHFDAHTNDGAGMYRTEQGGEIKMVTLMAGASGTQIVTAPDFTGTLSVSNPDMPTSAYRQGSHFGMQLGSYAYTGVDWRVTGTLFTGMHVAGSWYPGVYWSVQLSLGSSVELITGSQQMNAHMFQGGILFSLDADDVPTDSIWDYYNNDILPDINPDNAALPDGYQPDPDTSDPDDDEPIETPVITGDDMELQTDRTLTAPSDFITMYMITPPILSQFGRTLWTSLANYNPQDPTSADIFKNFYAVLNEQVTGSLDIGSIMNFIISVRQFPFAVSDITNIYELVGNSISFGTGALPIECGSAAQVYRLTSTIGVLDLGEVTIADYSDFKLYNDFRDYYNTSVSAYLPYCGTVELNPIEAINSTIHCYYAIDFYTGECTAFLTTTSEDGHTIVSGSKSGTIGVLIPITATNSGQVAARHLSDNAKDSMLITSASGNLFGIVGGIASGNIMGAVSNATGLAQIGAQQKMLDAERQGRSAVMAPSLSGGVGAAAFVSPATASILVRRGTYARQKIVNYPQTCGYPATSSGQLKTYHGYTECYNVNVDSINCTEEEKAAIKLALESGVYLSDV